MTMYTVLFPGHSVVIFHKWVYKCRYPIYCAVSDKILLLYWSVSGNCSGIFAKFAKIKCTQKFHVLQ